MAAYAFSGGLILLFSFVFFVLSPSLAALFTQTEEVQKLVVNVLRIIALFQPFTFLVQIMTNALQGAGETKVPMYSTLVGIWGIRIGVGYLLAMQFELGLAGVWYAYALDVTVRGIVLLCQFQRHIGKKKRNCHIA